MQEKLFTSIKKTLIYNTSQLKARTKHLVNQLVHQRQQVLIFRFCRGILITSSILVPFIWDLTENASRLFLTLALQSTFVLFNPAKDAKGQSTTTQTRQPKATSKFCRIHTNNIHTGMVLLLKATRSQTLFVLLIRLVRVFLSLNGLLLKKLLELLVRTSPVSQVLLQETQRGQYGVIISS